jgi:hypothetical protein
MEGLKKKRFRQTKGTKHKSHRKKSPSKTKRVRPFTKSLPIAYGHIFSPSCGHCIDMQQDWDHVKKTIGPKMKLYDIGDDHSNGVTHFNNQYNTSLSFDGFPTIFKLSSPGKSVEYYDTYYTNQSNNNVKQLAFRSKKSILLWLYS